MIKEILKALNGKVYPLLYLQKDLPRTIKENLTALKPVELSIKILKNKLTCVGK